MSSAQAIARCAAFLALAASACRGEDSPKPAASQGGSTGGPVVCPSGQVEAPAGGCMPVGIQGCAEMFLEENGLCYPTIDKCPPGTIPKFSEGCVPVGIPGCAQEFI